MAGKLDEVLKSYHIVDFKEDDELRQQVRTYQLPSRRVESTLSNSFLCTTSLTNVPNPRNVRDKSGLDASDAVPGIEPTPGPRDDPASLCTYVHPVSETQPSASGVLALPGEPIQHFGAGNMVNHTSNYPADGFQNRGIPSAPKPTSVPIQTSKSCCEETSSPVVKDEKKVTKKYFDGFFIYCDDNEDLVWKLNSILTKFLTLRGNRPPSFCLDFSELHHPSPNKLDFVEEVLTRSSYCFVIFSNNTAKGEEEEGFLKHQKDQALWKMITGQKSAVVVPVIIHKEARVNGPLNIYHPLKVYQLLCSKTLDEVDDVSLLTEKDLKSNILENIKRLLNKGSMQDRVVLEDDFSNSCSRSASSRLSSHQQIIQEQNVYLVDNMDPDNGLLNHLFSKKVISFHEKETIASKPTFFVKNEELLRLLYMKSRADFDTFLEALRSSNQSHIADKLILKS